MFDVISVLIGVFMIVSEEIVKQIIDSDAKVIFGLAVMSKLFEKITELIPRPIKIVYVKMVESESLPASGIDMNELINPKSKCKVSVEMFQST